MKSYQSGDDLRELGINLLTGEACGLGMRVLCDLDEDGIKLWEAFTRSKADTEGWNDGKASVMIPHSMFQDLWIFGQVMNGTKVVFLGGHVHSNQWTETEYTVGYNGDEPIIEKSKHPVKDWKPTAFAIDDEERMQTIRDSIKAGFFFVSRFYKKSDHPGTGLDNQHAMSGRTV
jgi:hypothetical protein